MVVRAGATLGVYDLSGKAIESIKNALAPEAPLRFVRVSPEWVAFATWDGGLAVVTAEGTSTLLRLDQRRGLSVVADVAVSDGRLYVAAWCGDILTTELGSRHEVQPLTRHSHGIQALAAEAGVLYVCDFEGRLVAMDGSGVTRTLVPLEARILSLTVQGGPVRRLAALGERYAYHVPLDCSGVDATVLPIHAATCALGFSQRPIVIDEAGSGARLDRELNADSVFQAQPHVVPTSADDGGRYCVVRGAEGRYMLIEKADTGVQSRIVYTQESGTMAISPDGAHLAIGDGSGIYLMSPDRVGA